MAAGAEEDAFDGGEGEVEDFSNFLVGEVFVAAEDEGEALFFWQSVDGGVDGVLEFGLEGDVVGADLGFVGGLLVVVVLALVHGDFVVPVAAAALVEDEVAGDGEEPGGEFGGGFVAWGGFPDAEEDLLGDVFGVVGATEHFGDGADHGVLVAFDKDFECLGVAGADVGHEDDVAIIAIRDGFQVKWLLGGLVGGMHSPVRRPRGRAIDSEFHRVCKPGWSA